MSYKRESSSVEQPFRKRAKTRGWKALKFAVPGVNGYPDRLVLKGIRAEARNKLRSLLGDAFMSQALCNEIIREILAECIEFVELKSPDASRDAAHLARQLRRQTELQDLGFTVSVLESREDVERWFDAR